MYSFYDFNYDIAKRHALVHTDHFCNTMQAYGFHNYINKPTHFSQIILKATSIIDHIWHSMCLSGRTFVISPPLSDHLACAIIFDARIVVEMSKVTFRDMLIDNKTNFVNNLVNEVTNYSVPNQHVDLTTNSLNKWLNELCNNYFPIKTKHVSIKRIKKPWLSVRLIKCINEKHWLLKLLRLKLINHDIIIRY